MKIPERYRLKVPESHPLHSKSGEDEGAFVIPVKRSINLFCIACPGMGWEHVSVSVRLGKSLQSVNRTPNWQEMCLVKSKFWYEEDCVIQYHPPKSEYVNMHPFVLHLWRPNNFNIPTPPKIMV